MVIGPEHMKRRKSSFRIEDAGWNEDRIGFHRVPAAGLGLQIYHIALRDKGYVRNILPSSQGRAHSFQS